MKYIRTKDAYGKEIVALFDDRPIEKGGNVLKFSQKSIVLRNGIVIKRKDFDNSKQTNTIEELVDKYLRVFVGKDKKMTPYVMFDKDDDRYFSKNESVVYACIWIQLPNGAYRLEPVAKMNEKGELELL